MFFLEQANEDARPYESALTKVNQSHEAASPLVNHPYEAEGSRRPKKVQKVNLGYGHLTA